MATLTEQELNAPGGMATTDGGFQSAVPPNFNPTLSRPVQGPTNDKGAPVNAQMFGTPPNPDINSELNRIKTEALSIQDILNQRQAAEQTIGQSFNSPEYDQGIDYIDTNLTDQEITDIEQRQLRLFQKEIDATNQVYDQLLNEARMEGQGRLGSQRAMAARGGLLGSDFGASQKQKVQAFNTDVNRAIQAERQAKIGTIMGTVRQAILDEKTEKRQAKQQGAENYLEWLKGEATRKQNNINLAASALLTQGLNPSEMDENELAAIAQEAGTTVENLRFQYQQLASQQAAATAKSDLETRKTEAEIAKIEADIEQGKVKTIGEGTMLYNTETGEFFKNPKTYKPDAPSGLKIAGGILDQQTIAGVHLRLQDTRGEPYQDQNGNWVTPPPEDNYANTKVYMDELEGFVALGGDPKDFIEEFDPNIYINPNDPTRSFLQSQMKKTVQEDVEEKSAFEIMVEQRKAEQSGN